MYRLFYTIFLLLSLTSVGFTEEEFNSEIPQLGDSPQVYSPAQTTNNDVINRTLFNYRQGAFLIYNNSSSLTIGPGELACNSNTGATNGQTIIYRRTTANITATTVNLDTGSTFSANTAYYVYANCDAAATTFTITLSLNASTPSGVTNYKQLGNFTTDGSGNILNIIDLIEISRFGTWNSVIANTPHQAATDGQLVVNTSSGDGKCYTDSTPAATTLRTYGNSCTTPVRKGDYYNATYGAGLSWFVPSGQ